MSRAVFHDHRPAGEPARDLLSLTGMARVVAFSVAVAASASLAFAAACGTSNDEQPGKVDAGVDGVAGDGGSSPTTACNAGCPCFSVDACPTGCYVEHTPGEPPFCGNGIVACDSGAWSVGTPIDNCGNGIAAGVSVDGGDVGICCGDISDFDDRAVTPEAGADGGTDAAGQ